MVDCNKKQIKKGDFVVRHNVNDGWACDDCEIPLQVIDAPKNSNRKLDLLNLYTGKREHFVRQRIWQDMGLRGVVEYSYEIIDIKSWMVDNLLASFFNACIEDDD